MKNVFSRERASDRGADPGTRLRFEYSVCTLVG